MAGTINIDQATDLAAALERARERNAGLWHVIDHGGVATPVAAIESTLDGLRSDTVENEIAVALENYAVAHYKRFQALLGEYAGIETDRYTFDLKTQTELHGIALKTALEEYTQAAKEYALTVKDTIMKAREFEAQADFGKLGVEQAKALAEKDRVEAKKAGIEAEMSDQTYKMAELPVLINRRKMEAARAAVKASALKLDITEEEAKTLEAIVGEQLAKAELATIIADTATLLVANQERRLLLSHKDFAELIDKAWRAFEADYDNYTYKLGLLESAEAQSLKGLREQLRQEFAVIQYERYVNEVRFKEITREEAKRTVTADDVLAMSRAVAAEYAEHGEVDKAKLATLIARLENDRAITAANLRTRLLTQQAHNAVKENEAMNQQITTRSLTISKTDIEKDQESYEVITKGE